MTFLKRWLANFVLLVIALVCVCGGVIAGVYIIMWNPIVFLILVVLGFSLLMTL
jgi:hypothetical protein